MFFGGSRGKRIFVHSGSDYDVFIIVKHKFLKKYKKLYKSNDDFDFMIKSYTDFKKEVPEEWARYAYEHVKVLIDKNKKIQKLVNEKARFPKKVIKEHISGNLDGYINYVFRSLQCHRVRNKLAARLQANRTIDFFFRAIFSLHNGRTVPYYKYLYWELKKYPLTEFPMNPKQIIKLITKIINKADIKSQQKLLKTTEKVFRKHGYGNVFDSWGHKLDWMKTFRR